MEFLINTFLGFLIMQISEVLRRDRSSNSSPVKFDILFFLKDNLVKIVLSLALSVAISLVIWMNFGDATTLFKEHELYGNLLYVAVGAVPEYILQKVKKKFGITQPEQVVTKDEVYKRK